MTCQREHPNNTAPAKGTLTITKSRTSMAPLPTPALAIILHKPFDAMAVSTLRTAGGCSRFSRHLSNILFALVTPLGAVFVGPHAPSEGF